MRHILTVLCCLLLCLHRLPAQSSRPIYAGLRAHYGYLWIHSQSLAALGQPLPWGTELDLGRHFITQKAWNGCNCYPRAGLALTYWNYDSPALGQGLTAVAYMEPVFFTQHRIQAGFRWGMGLAYQNTPYDSLTNPYNLAYSTRIAFPLQVNAILYGRLSQRTSLRLSLNYNHVSNGGIRLPNKGLNYPSLSLGADVYMEPVDFEARSRLIDKPRPEKRNRLYLGHFSGLSQYDPTVPRQYWVGGVWAKYARNLGRRSGVSAGLEYIHDLGRRHEARRWGMEGDFRQAAITLGHEFWLGRVVFSQELGIYLYDQLDLRDPVYQRYALIYHFHPKIFGGISLKAHRHVANYLDLRLGVRL